VGNKGKRMRIFKEKNACHIIWEAFWEEYLGMSKIIQMIKLNLMLFVITDGMLLW
jgi:hypothetical protein